MSVFKSVLNYKLVELFPSSTFEHIEKDKLIWMTRFRWFIILGLIIFFYLSLAFKIFEPSQKLALIISLLSLILINTLTVSWLKQEFVVESKMLFQQILVDLLVTTYFFSFTGSINNPFFPFFFFLPILAPFLLEKKHLIIFAFLFGAGMTLAMTSGYWASASIALPIAHEILITSYVFVGLIFLIGLFGLSQTLNTHQKKLELIRKQKTRMDRLKALGALSAGFNHEIATPMNTIKLSLERFKRNQKLDERSLDLAIEALHECEESLLKINQMKFSHQKGKLQNIDLKVISEKILNELKEKYPQSSWEFHGLSFQVMAHEILLGQTLLDLLENALEESNFIRIEFQNPCLKIINYTGEIPELILNHLGEPFNSSKKNGNGLGLFNASNYLQLLGGKFEILNLSPGVCASLTFKEMV